MRNCTRAWFGYAAVMGVTFLSLGMLLYPRAATPSRSLQSALESRPHAIAPIPPQKEALSPQERRQYRNAFAATPLSFEPNQGQVDAQVKYLSRGDGYTLFLTNDEAVLSLRSASRPDNSVLRMRLEGSRAPKNVTGEHELGGKSNYLIGTKPNPDVTDIPHFGRVRYEEVYPGVDVVYYGNQRKLEYDFVVAPGADPSVVKVVQEGTEKV